MKYCPNPDCFYLELNDEIAEYQDHVELCADCQGVLKDGKAPPAASIRREPQNLDDISDAPLFPDDLAIISVVDTRDDALWLKSELEKAGIPAVIQATADQLLESEAPDSGSPDKENSDTGDGETTGSGSRASFDVKVMARQTLPAMNHLQTLLADEADATDDGYAYGEGGTSYSGSDEADWQDGAWGDRALGDEALGDEALGDRTWEDGELDDGEDNPADLVPDAVATPIITIFTIFCVLLVIGYLLFVGFPTGLFE